MKKCLFCGKEFEPNAQNQVFCSRKCGHSIKTNCAYCGKEIIRQKHKSDVYFCSCKCAALHAGRTIEKECPICGNNFTASKSDVRVGWGKYCSKTCAAEGMKITHYLTCPQCGKEFIGDKDNWMKQKFCSKECMKKAFEKPIEKELLYKLYVEEELTSREIEQIIGRSKKVVLDYLKKYDIPVRPDGIKNRKRIRCSDGHMVRSYYERAFDNLLNRNCIEHEYDPHLPFNRRCMADFKIKNVYVEIWGMMEDSKYRERREKKLKLYRENECKLLEIFPEDFKNLSQKMSELQSLINL